MIIYCLNSIIFQSRYYLCRFLVIQVFDIVCISFGLSGKKHHHEVIAFNEILFHLFVSQNLPHVDFAIEEFSFSNAGSLGNYVIHVVLRDA